MSGAFSDEVRADLESKIAFLERANSELSDVVYRQQGELETLRLQVNALLQRMDSNPVDDAPRSPDHERPPHY